jgi:hypothetical protein
MMLGLFNFAFSTALIIVPKTQCIKISKNVEHSEVKVNGSVKIKKKKKKKN